MACRHAAKMQFDIWHGHGIGNMEVYYMKIKHGLVLGAVLGLATTSIALADPTALNLVSKANDYVGVQSKDKILDIDSEKSVSSLQPNIWHVIYYDDTVVSKTVDVKFGAGQEMDVSHPMRPFMLPAKERDVIDQSKLKVDSDRALDIATQQPLLKGLILRSSRITLENGDYGVAWKVELWAAKVNDSTKEANVGTVYVSAEDGSVVKLDLHPDSAS
jgi:hypothetical protein